MATVNAKQALLPNGWTKEVVVTIDANWRFENVKADSPKQFEHTGGIPLPTPVNVRSRAFQRAMTGLTGQRGLNPEGVDCGV